MEINVDDVLPKRIAYWDYYDGPTEGFVEYEIQGKLISGAFREIFTNYSCEWRLFLVTMDSEFVLEPFSYAGFGKQGMLEGCIIGSPKGEKLRDLMGAYSVITSSQKASKYLAICYEMFRPPYAWAPLKKESVSKVLSVDLSNEGAEELILLVFGKEFNFECLSVCEP